MYVSSCPFSELVVKVLLLLRLSDRPRLPVVFQLDADDAKVTFEEEPGQDVYCETQMPL